MAPSRADKMSIEREKFLQKIFSEYVFKVNALIFSRVSFISPVPAAINE